MLDDLKSAAGLAILAAALGGIWGWADEMQAAVSGAAFVAYLFGRAA